MKFFLLLPLLFTVATSAAQEYALGPDSARQTGVPEGKVTQHEWRSDVFPGTVRDYWIYVPAQYAGSKDAALMVFQDGGGFVNPERNWRAPIVFDNLIHRGEMPITIGIFVNPGVMPALKDEYRERYNRSFEYDALGDRYSRFLIEELLPEIEKEYRISDDPNDRAIAGSSSGAIAAFTVAWNRPDSFRRVLSFVGSYNNLRGGQDYPSLVRKTEGKPLRVFLQDGRKDQSIYGGDWKTGNLAMASALEYAGYELRVVIGNEGHNSRHGSAILPDALRWLWQAHPEPVGRPKPIGPRHTVSEIIDPNEEWEVVSSGHNLTEGPAIDREGNVYFTDLRESKIHKISTNGKVSLFKEDTGNANGLMIGPDGRLYACQNGRKRIVAYSTEDGSETVIAEDVGSNDLAVTSDGLIYFTDFGNKRVWLIDEDGRKRVVHEGIGRPNGVILSPDESLLMVADYGGRFVWSFQIQPDGSLANGQPFYHLEIPGESDNTAADGMTLAGNGFLFVTTNLGLQICDQAGRVNAILPSPQPGPLTNVIFAGPEMQTLYVTSADKVFKRKVRWKGILPWAPSKPPRPRL